MLKIHFLLCASFTERSAQDHDHEEAGKEDHHEEDVLDGIFVNGATLRDISSGVLRRHLRVMIFFLSVERRCYIQEEWICSGL